jgi:hypothetical protein
MGMQSMIEAVKVFADKISWAAVISSLAANAIFLIANAILFWRHVKRKAFFKVRRDREGLCALSIGLGKNDPYNAVVEFMGEDQKKNIVRYVKSHRGNREAHLTVAEIQKTLQDIREIVGRLRRKHFKEVLVFYAGPVSAAFQIGYFFKNFAGFVKFMQLDRRTNRYVVMSVPEQ